MKIELTQKQIEVLIKNESDKLQSEFDANVKALEKKLQSDIQKLQSKFKYIEYNFDEPVETKPKVKIDGDKLKQLILEEKKSVKEAAEHFGTSTQSIRSKLWNMKIKLTELK